MTEILMFALGLLCGAILMYLVMGARNHAKAGVAPEATPEPASAVSRFLTQRPNNELARKYATASYYNEKEEAITRGEGYPV